MIEAIFMLYSLVDIEKRNLYYTQNIIYILIGTSIKFQDDGDVI